MNYETVKCYSNEAVRSARISSLITSLAYKLTRPPVQQYEAGRYSSALNDYQRAEVQVITSLNFLNCKSSAWFQFTSSHRNMAKCCLASTAFCSQRLQ